MSLGLKRGTVQLEPHDKQWDEAAIQTIKILKSILGDDAIDIQHIGSTAIPAIKAKPIIDIVVGVTDFDKVMFVGPIEISEYSHVCNSKCPECGKKMTSPL